MMGRAEYDYRELAYDLYHSGDELLDQLIEMRRRRGMTQTQLADEMNVSQGYISQIENGKTNMVSLLTDYALEVGARIEYVVEPAEAKPDGSRHYLREKIRAVVNGVDSWESGEFTFERQIGRLRVESHASGTNGNDMLGFSLLYVDNDALAPETVAQGEAVPA